MTAENRTPQDDRELRTFWVIIGLAIVGALTASLAGVLLWVIDPADGSTTEAALGLTAAVGGLTTGAVFGAGAIYAQVKNLWRFAPGWFRTLAYGVLLAMVLAGLVISLATSAA